MDTRRRRFQGLLETLSVIGHLLIDFPMLVLGLSYASIVSVRHFRRSRARLRAAGRLIDWPTALARLDEGGWTLLVTSHPQGGMAWLLPESLTNRYPDHPLAPLGGHANDPNLAQVQSRWCDEYLPQYRDSAVHVKLTRAEQASIFKEPRALWIDWIDSIALWD